MSTEPIWRAHGCGCPWVLSEDASHQEYREAWIAAGKCQCVSDDDGSGLTIVDSGECVLHDASAGAS